MKGRKKKEQKKQQTLGQNGAERGKREPEREDATERRGNKRTSTAKQRGTCPRNDKGGRIKANMSERHPRTVDRSQEETQA